MSFVKVTEQKYDSRNTSINKLNKVYTNYSFKPNSFILDYGGGKYNTNIDYMKKFGSAVVVYDPYNRSIEENERTFNLCNKYNLDYVVCSNVLNVIKEHESINEVLSNIKNISREETIILFTVYEGNRSGMGEKTTKGYQRNQKYSDYLNIIELYFNIIKVERGIIVCRK